jgi:MFS family permease
MNPQRNWTAWINVLICTLMVAMAFGALVNVAVFLTPLAAEFGWPRADISLAYSIAAIGTGAGGILMGYYADRFPVRRIALAGALVPGISLLLLSRIESVVELYIYHALMGVVGLGAIMAPMNRLASLWFSRNPGLAIGIVAAGGAFGQGVMPYLSRHLVLIQGWRGAYVTMGVCYLALLVPLALLLRDPPASTATGAGGPVAGAVNPYAVSRPVLLALLSAAVIFCCACMATPIVHVVTLGSDRGLGPREAASLLAMMMIFGMGGRIVFGLVADRLGNLQSYIVASVGQTATALWFPAMQTQFELMVLSAVFGLFFSGAMTAFIACAREYSPAGHTGLSIGIVMFFAWVGMALGGWQGGLFYDICRDYVLSFMSASVAGGVNLGILALLYLYTVSWPGQGRALRREVA